MSARKSQEEMFPIIERWERSTEQRESFCQSHGVTLATFSYWRTKYLKAQNGSVEAGFLQLTPVTKTGLEIEYPNGVKVKLSQTSTLADLKAMIQLV